MTGDPTAYAALTAAAGLGPFFELVPAPEPDWVSWTALCTDPAVLRGRLDEVRAVLSSTSGGADVAPPVVASITHLGLVARLVAPVLGAALVTSALPVAPSHRVWMRLSGANPLPLAVAPETAVDVTRPRELAEAIDGCWLGPAVSPLTAAVRALAPVSAQVLAGNVTSAVAGALRMTAEARPELTLRAEATLDELLRAGSLAGTGRRTPGGAFVRRSCCLFYRLPGAGTCGDCVLGAPRSSSSPATG